MRLGVAGVGLIGGSIALAAGVRRDVVVGYDTKPEHVSYAASTGMIAQVAPSFDALAADVDVLVLASPLDATLEQLARLAARPSPAELIIDVASLKVPVVLAADGIETFVGTHPIAGSERNGPSAARADLFEGRTWTLDAAASPGSLERARDFVRLLGAQPIEIDAHEHDRTIALTSHLPQLVSVALGAVLAARLGDESVAPLCGTGIRSLLRLGASSWPMWRAVFEANSVFISQEVRRLAAILTEAAESLETSHVDALAPRFAAAASAVTRLGDGSPDRKGQT